MRFAWNLNISVRKNDWALTKMVSLGILKGALAPKLGPLVPFTVNGKCLQQAIQNM